jgi:hypothetical protein
MATRNFYVPGIDPDSVSPWPASQADMEVMFRQMTPASDLGMCIQQSGVPSVISYSELATFLWLKTTTGELHYYDGSGWEKVRATTSVATADITGVLDGFTGMGALKVLRRNAGNTAYEWVTLSTAITTNVVNPSSIVNAPGAGYVLQSDVGGVYEHALFSTMWQGQFGLTAIPLIQIYDVDGTTTAGQVLRSNGHTEAISASYVEDLLRDNSTPVKKLRWETIVLTPAAGVVNMNGALGPAFSLSIAANVTSFVVALQSGQSASVCITQTGSFTVAFHGDIEWAGGTAPTISTGAGKKDVITFIKIGDVIYGSALQDFS